MRLDKFSNPIFNDNDVFSAIYSGKQHLLSKIIVDPSEEITQLETISELEFIKYDAALEQISVEDFDKTLQTDWFMPSYYQNLDIETWILSQCNTAEETARVAEEFVEFNNRNLINVLRWLKYFVDTCRKNKILWGAGRGSSVASYVLFKLGVHKIDSLKYQLDWKEFLRPDEE